VVPGRSATHRARRSVVRFESSFFLQLIGRTLSLSRAGNHIASKVMLTGMFFTASTALIAIAKIGLDVWLVGRLGSSELAAFSFVFPVLFLMLSIGRGLYIATASIFAGANYIQGGRVNRTALLKVLTLSLLLGCGVSVVAYCSLPWLLRLMGAGDLQARLDEYFIVWLWTVPMMFLSANTFAIARNLGYIKLASALTLGATIAGALASLILVPAEFSGRPLGIVGSAYSTLLTSFLSTAASLFVVFYFSRARDANQTETTMSALLVRTSRIAFPVLFSNILAFAFMSYTTRILAGFGEDAVAAYAIIGRFEQFLFVFQTAFVTVAIPAMSRRFSSGNPGSGRAFAFGAGKLMLAVGALLALLLMVAATTVADWAAPTSESAALCAFYLTYCAIATVFQGIFLLATTALNLVGQARKALLCYFLNYCVLSPIVIGLLALPSAQHALGALAACALVSGVLACCYANRTIARQHAEKAHEVGGRRLSSV
jgi:Na+-driven multidrug efflux pump